MHQESCQSMTRTRPWRVCYRWLLLVLGHSLDSPNTVLALDFTDQPNSLLANRFKIFDQLQREKLSAKRAQEAMKPNSYNYPVELLEIERMMSVLHAELDRELKVHEDLKTRHAEAKGRYISLQDKHTVRNLDHSLSLLRSLVYQDKYREMGP